MAAFGDGMVDEAGAPTCSERVQSSDDVHGDPTSSSATVDGDKGEPRNQNPRSRLPSSLSTQHAVHLAPASTTLHGVSCPAFNDSTQTQYAREKKKKRGLGGGKAGRGGR